jgi:hypothetical protein
VHYIARVVFMVVSKMCVCVELVGESPDEGCLDALDKWENLQMWDVWMLWTSGRISRCGMSGCFGQVGESPDVGWSDEWACEGVSRRGTCGWVEHVKVSQDEGCMGGRGTWWYLHK